MEDNYVSKNFERPHYVPLNKKIFDAISLNIRDEAGDLVAFEHGKVIITLHFRHSKTQYFIEMVLPLSHLNSIGYDNKPHNAWEDCYYTQAFPEESALQEEVMFLFIADQCCKEDTDLEVSSKVLLEVPCPH